MKRFLRRFLSLFSWRRAEQDLDREIASHLALLEDEHRRRGLTPDEARLAARRALGSEAHAKDLHRDARAFMWVDDCQRDVRHAARMLFHNPGFTAVAVLTLALGIGANTAIFSVVNAVLLRPLPYMDPDRLVQVITPPPSAAPSRPPGLAAPRMAALIPTRFDTLRRGTRALSHVAGYVLTTSTLTGQGDAVRLTGIQATASLFPMLGVPPALGRTFELREEVSGGDAVVVLAHETWKRYFASDPGIVGRIIALDGLGRTVVGVMPDGFAFPDAHVQYWVPYVPPAANARAILSLSVMGRLRDGVSRETAEGDVNAVMLDAALPAARRFELAGVQDELVAPVRPALLILAGAVGLVLLIACVNLANLLLARMATRQREIAVRRAVGASAGRLVRQLLTESVLLSLLGGVAGTLLAFGGVRLLRVLGTSLPRRDLGPGMSLPRLDEISIDASTLIFTAGIALLTGILFGLLPALRHSRRREMDILREQAGGNRVRGALVVAEIAMAMMLLVGGALLIHSFIRLSNVETGYDPTNVLTFQATPRPLPAPQAMAFADQFVARLTSLPGVTAAGYGNNLPLVLQGFRRDVSPVPPVKGQRIEAPQPGMHAISPGFVTAMGMPVLEGRGFSEGEAASREALISRTFARSGFFDGPAIGRRIYTGRGSWEVVGIVEDLRQFGMGQRPDSEMYVVEFVPPPPGLGGTYFAVRSNLDPSSITASVRAIARELDPQATVDNIATMEQIVSHSIAGPRFNAVLLGVFAAMAVALAAIGIYGVLVYVVTQRTREIGIRMALGARRAQVVGLVVRQSAWLTVAGMMLGVSGAAALSRYLETLLFGVTPLDAGTFAAAAVAFAVVAMVAVYGPARRATRVDPLVALRSE
jgi:putative ABC transport system permease protein